MDTNTIEEALPSPSEGGWCSMGGQHLIYHSDAQELSPAAQKPTINNGIFPAKHEVPKHIQKERAGAATGNPNPPSGNVIKLSASQLRMKRMMETECPEQVTHPEPSTRRPSKHSVGSDWPPLAADARDFGKLAKPSGG